MVRVDAAIIPPRDHLPARAHLPGPRLQSARRSGRPRRACLQPVVELDAARRVALRRINPAAWTRHRTPIAVLRRDRPGALGRADRRRGLHGRRQPRPRRVPTATSPTAPTPGTRRHPDRAAARPDRLLLRRVRHPRVDADLLGRPRHPGRRPLQVGLRCGAALRRHRPPLPPRLLPPADRRRRPPGACAAGSRPRAAAPAPRARARRPAARGQRRVRRPPGARRGLGRRRSAACRSCCSTPTSRANDPADRPITHILYVRGREMRLCQELVLGIGGVRALRALGIEPAVWHLNEGHSAFLLLERARELVAAEPGLAAGEALRRVGRNSVFTIHTPVPAGNEVFERDLVSRRAPPVVREAAAWSRASCSSSAAATPTTRTPPFDMTAFVLRHAADANAGQPAARRDRHRHLAGPGRPPDRRRSPTASTSRPGSVARCGGSSSAPSASSLGVRPQRPGAAGRPARRSTTRSCGAPTGSRSAR